MACVLPFPVYANPPFRGLKFVGANRDGYSIDLIWYKAYSSYPEYPVLVYNIYYSSIKEDVFKEGVKFVVTDPNCTSTTLSGFTPGDVYYFAVRASLFESNIFSALPDGPNGLKIYPESPLTYDISATDIIIPVSDIDLFPMYGIIQIGAEIIGYSSVDLVDGELISSYNQRGLYSTEARPHTTDGYDGYRYYDNPFVMFFKGFEENNENIVLEECKFTGTYAATLLDGYRNQTDLVSGTDDLQVVEDSNADFPKYCFGSYRREHPADILSGKCIGSYMGGEYCCPDEPGQPVRGLGFNDHNNQRLEVLLETTGEPVVLVRRMWSGKTSKHYDSSKENTTYRGLDNYGTHMVTGYEQIFSSRRSDGRILVRFGPTQEDLVREEPGIENKFIPDCWTLVTPYIQDSDFIIRFNEDGSEEWRYEIVNVTRNRTILGESGSQKFTAVRVRKTDPIYQWRAIRSTATMPTVVTTSLAMVPGLIPPHLHQIVINEGITTLAQVNQTTSVTEGHNHQIINGIVIEAVGHSHNLILP